MTATSLDLQTVGTLLTALALFLTAASLFYLARQTKASEHATIAVGYANIIALGDALNNMFVDKPHLFAQLFAGASVPSEKTIETFQREKPELFFSAMRWLDYFETILVVWPTIPPHLHEPWRNYIKSCFADSGILRRIVLDTEWFGDDLRQLCEEALKQTQPAV